MTAYLVAHRPARAQYRRPRRARPTGLTVVHTAESVMDSVGSDTGAENVAAFIRGRSDPGSYHDLVDSDSIIQLVPYESEAYQDGTGSNPYALSISFALRAADWPRLSAAKRAGFLEQGAIAFARQQAWLAAHDYPTTPLRRVTKAESDRGMAGFIAHGTRDPGRRTDPGAAFPWSEWFAACAKAIGAPVTEVVTESILPKEITMIIVLDADGHKQWLCDANTRRHIGLPERNVLVAAGAPYVGGDHPSADRTEFLRARTIVTAPVLA